LGPLSQSGGGAISYRGEESFSHDSGEEELAGRDYSGLLAEIADELVGRSPRSAALNRAAKANLVDGGSHTIRLMEPFAPRIIAARGGRVADEDGHDILDFWQGHLANILGHNPEVVTSELARAFDGGFGLQVGMVDRLQSEVAEILCRRTGDEQVRLTTSGTLANMYAVILSCAFTGRSGVMKVGGGWHGGHPWGLKGSFFDGAEGTGFGGVDSDGIPEALTDDVVVTGFNDPDRLSDDFKRHGSQLACFVVEPLIGAGGLIPATREYLILARELSQKHGALLIFDEVVNGFRFHAGSLSSLYGIEPDLAIYGKAIGGGMPVAALAGRADIMAQAGRDQACRVFFSGGTYCAHPASLLAAKTSMIYLIEHENEIYPRLGVLGEQMRQAIVRGFADEGILARATGSGDELPSGSSLGMVHFPYDEATVIDRPEMVCDPEVCDVALRDHVLGPALLLEDVHMVHGHGAAATAHTEQDMRHLENACRKVARRIKPYLLGDPNFR
jgi:glutamate-1-semialdehyde 2,1-aminomutase